MGKKGVLLDNGKAARSSMDLYWKAAQKKANTKGEKKQVRQEDIEDRVESGHQRWKMHKQKMINKMYEKLEKKQKVDAQVLKERQKKAEEELQRDMLQKELNKNRPIKIPGFKNMDQLKAKMQFEQVKTGNNSNNKLIPRSEAEQLDQAEIIQILREKKAKKQLEKAQKQRIQKNLRQRQKHDDMMMNGYPEDKTHKLEPPKKSQSIQQAEAVEPEPQNFFKSELLQKIERGQHLHKKEDKIVEQKIQKEEEPQPKIFASKFVPRALWGK